MIFFKKVKLILICTALVVTPAIFNTHIASTFDVSKVAVLYMSAIGLAFLWIFSNDSFSSALKNIHLNYPIAAYFGSFIVSTIFSISPITSLLGEYKRFEGLISIACYLVLFYSIASISSRKHIYIILYSMVVAAVPIALYGILQHFGYDYWEWSVFNPNRVSSTLGNSVFFAAYLIMIIPVVTAFYFEKSWLFLPIILLLSGTLAFTGSRAATLGLIISIPFFFYITRHLNLSKKKILTLLSITAIVSFLYLPVIKRMNDVLRVSDCRIDIYKSGLDIIKDYPIAGVGLDCIGFVYPKYSLRYTGEGFAETQNRLHSDVLDTLATRGIIGLGTYIWLLVSFSNVVLKYFRNYKLERRQVIIMGGLTSGLLGFIIQNQVVFASTPINVMVWGMMGLCVAISRLE